MQKTRHGNKAGEKESFLQRIVEVFLRGNLSIMLIAISLLVGAVALMVTPREEELQIVVPLADVYVFAPGLSAEQMERQIATRLEKLLYQIDGVEYVYSMSKPGAVIATVRFYVGQNRENSLVKIYNKMQSNMDFVPEDVTGWVIKPIEIDDVPIVNVTLWSEDEQRYDDYALRRLAEEIETQLQSVKNTNKIFTVGGRPRVVRVELDPEALASRQTSPLEVAWALGISNQRLPSGEFDRMDQSFLVDAGKFIGGVEALRDLVVAVIDGSPVYLKDVVQIKDDLPQIKDSPDERASYTWIGFGPSERFAPKQNSGSPIPPSMYPAVHVAVAKKKGTNAVWVAEAVEAKLWELEKTHIPDGVHARITRNYGETANDKVNELVEGLAVAIIIVIALIIFSLGWKEAFIVAVAVPITFALTLIINYLCGYTVNRVTLFALTLALGLVVDDPVVDVENIYRHFKMRKESPFRAVLTAVNEVRPPIILATLAVIFSFIPLFFISGMMGPYMAPMALNVPLSMLMSIVVAFTITPWMCYHLLKSDYHKAAEHQEKVWTVESSLTYKVYARVLAPFLRSRGMAWGLLATMAGLFLLAGWLGAARLVPLKMLPFDNNNEFQIVVDMPEGTTLERTDAAARALADLMRGVPEVKDFCVYSGLASPMDFNSMVRHYYLRRGGNVADVRVNLLNKKDRAAQSHELVLRLRKELEAIAQKWNANIKLVESPPGPPVIATVTAEVYGEPGVPYERLQLGARVVAERLRREMMVCDVDTSVEDDQTKWIFELDQEKAALSGVSSEDVAKTVRLALSGYPATRMQIPDEANPLEIVLRLPRADRSSIERLKALYIKGRMGITQVREESGLRAAGVPLVQLGEIGTFRETIEDKTIYHKNLERVAYVFTEMAGRAPAEAIVDSMVDLKPDGEFLGKAVAPSKIQQTAHLGQTTESLKYVNQTAKPTPLWARTYYQNGGGIEWAMPHGTRVVWNGEGEWKITLDVFRDLGIAFGAACLAIYLLLVYQTGSYFMPLILMISIPLTLIGIMPGFWFLNQLGETFVGGFPNPVFFTATAMIGMIALSGIAVRNAILLVEFVHEALKKGRSLRDALLESGAVRFRPIFLTAGAAMLAAIPITLDPIFSGLAWALIFGLFVSTLFTLLVIPVTYDLVYRNVAGHGLGQENLDDENPAREGEIKGSKRRWARSLLRKYRRGENKK
ncbi:MAG: efflux RND transporter permease subunit [Candidatus Sumerlaeota bacterium]|nr:efflux RND transporter permease subunit [Candidatus Sumerlaeota bacterium]